jgi:hypothetical protein
MDDIYPQTRWVQIKVKNEMVDDFINTISVLQNPEGTK